jgi:metal-dependent amidase/aminoacylase/carboxypeptidase family protein
MLQDDRMQAIFRANAEQLVGAENIGRTEHRTGSTDMGDVSALMPVLHPYVGGATGIGHGADYVVQDYQMAVITGAKAMASTVIDLMADGAKEANQVVANHRVDMTSREYMNFMRTLASEDTYLEV